MLKNTFFLILSFLLWTACTNADKNGENNNTHTAAEAAQSNMAAEGGTKQLCYASKSKAEGYPGNPFNYEFIRFTIEGDKVRGTVRYLPYGTDSMKGSLTGVYKESTNEIDAEAEYLAEGEIYKEARSYKLLDDAVQMNYQDAQGEPARLPQVSCEEFESLLDEYHSQIIQQSVNTTDRSRLLKVEALKEMGFSREELQEVKFMERAVDLDRNYETNEYLLYVMDPMFCGTGGCNLLVINDKGETLSDISVVKLPVYTTTHTMEDQKNNQGAWKELYVWSQGYRRLTPADGKYPDNASMAPEIVEEQLALHPEMYTLLLDYID